MIWKFKEFYYLLRLIYLYIFGRKCENYFIKDNDNQDGLGYIKDFRLSKSWITWTKNIGKANVFYSKYEAYLYMYVFGKCAFCKIISLKVINQ